MSTYFYLGCKDCKERFYLGKRQQHPENPTKLKEFLYNHLECQLVYHTDHWFLDESRIMDWKEID